MLYPKPLKKRSSIFFESYDLSNEISIASSYNVAMSIRLTLAHAKRILLDSTVEG